jgi:hypothetical protein
MLERCNKYTGGDAENGMDITNDFKDTTFY